MGFENTRAVSADVSTADRTPAHPGSLESALSLLQTAGWRILRDHVDPLLTGRPVSFVLVGPGGSVVMETTDRLMDGRLDGFLAAAGSVAAVLPAEHRSRVRTILVLTGGRQDMEARCSAPAAVDTVPVEDLERWFAGLGADTVAADDAAGLTRVLRRAWSGAHGRLLSTADIPPQDACIPESSLRRRRRRRRRGRWGTGRMRRAAPRHQAAATAARDTRADLTMIDVVRVLLVSLAVLSGVGLLSAVDNALDPHPGGTTPKTTVTSSVVGGSPGGSRVPATPAMTP